MWVRHLDLKALLVVEPNPLVSSEGVRDLLLVDPVDAASSDKRANLSRITLMKTGRVSSSVTVLTRLLTDLVVGPEAGFTGVGPR